VVRCSRSTPRNARPQGKTPLGCMQRIPYDHGATTSSIFSSRKADFDQARPFSVARPCTGACLRQIFTLPSLPSTKGAHYESPGQRPGKRANQKMRGPTARPNNERPKNNPTKTTRSNPNPRPPKKTPKAFRPPAQGWSHDKRPTLGPTPQHPEPQRGSAHLLLPQRTQTTRFRPNKKLSESQTFRPSDLPTFRPSDLPTFRPSDLLTFRPSDLPTFRPSDLPTFRLSDFPTFRLSDFPTFRLSDFPTFRLSDFPTFRLSDFPTPRRNATIQSEPTISIVG
jgi:hypothetical protein